LKERRPVLSLRRACPERASAGARNEAKDPVNAREEALDEARRSKSVIERTDYPNFDLLCRLRTTSLLLRTAGSFAYAPAGTSPSVSRSGQAVSNVGFESVMHHEHARFKFIALPGIIFWGTLVREQLKKFIMNSNRNDRSNAPRGAEREERFSYPEEGYNSGYGSSQGEPYQYRAGSRFGDDRGDSNPNAYSSSPGNLYGVRGGEYSDYSPGYSTANDFSGQEPVRGRSQRSDREYRGYSEEDYPQYRERYKRSEYPETYRSGSSGYMSEHVGSDSGRRDYNQNPNEGNLYGNRYGSHQGNRPGNQRSAQRGYMSEDDYDRGSPFYGENVRYGKSFGNEGRDEGPHKGKGPRKYQRTDDRIEEDINDRLTDDPYVDASDVNVAVQKGEVILTGTVDDRQAKRRAEDIAESVSGVTHVENRIRVRSAADANPPLLNTSF
jgi:hypothetical protein